MSCPAEKDNSKEKEVKDKPEEDTKEPEKPNVKLEEKKSSNDLKKESKEAEDEKRMERARRFGMLQEKGSNLLISKKEDVDKRRERFKEELDSMEKEEKEEKEKEKERSREKDNNKRNNHDRYRYGKYLDRDYHRRDGGSGRGRYNPYKRFRGERRNFRK